MKKLFYLIVLIICVGCGKDTTLREGDIIFQTEVNEESKAWRNLTGSDITHCGIIVKKDDGSYHVLHMHHNMMLTPLGSFINHGFKNKYSVARVTDKEIKIDFKKYMGSDKDYQLRLNNDSYYNAELVYHIYKEDFGIELCTPRPLCEYNIDSTFVGYYIHPQQPIVTPYDLYVSPKVRTIQSHYAKDAK